MLLLVGALLPVTVFAGIVALRLAAQERAAVERRLAHSARMMAAGVEREVASTIRALQALAESERLDRGDLAAFYLEAKRVRRVQPSWLNVLLLSPDGRQLVNVNRPWGAELPRAIEPESFRRVLATREPVLGDLARGADTWAFPVRVPVMRDGELKYVLTAVITPEALAAVVTHQLPPNEEWTRTIVDSRGVVVARTREPERFVGQVGTPQFLEQVFSATEGVYRNTTLDGVPVYLAFSRTPSWGWTASIAAPRMLLDGQARRSILLVTGFGLALLVISGLGALLLSRRISRGIAAAAAAAEVLAHGGRPTVPPSRVEEVERLGEALARSADLLRRRERERDDLLDRAEAARADAEAASRAKDEFLAMLGHELRNPLAPIVTSLEIVRLRGLASAREWEVIDRQVQHLARLVDDLLDVSRITRGKIELQRRRIDLAGVVAKAVEMASPLIEQRRHHLRVDVPPGIELEADPVRLAQVFSNLLTNAARYTEPGGHIEVLGRREEGEVLVAVTDDGQGLSADLLPRIFELFVQGPRSLDRQQGGLGIGLTLVRSLVDLHGGRVEARSEGPGRGSVFLVHLPASVDPPAA